MLLVLVLVDVEENGLGQLEARATSLSVVVVTVTVYKAVARSEYFCGTDPKSIFYNCSLPRYSMGE